MEQFDRLKIYKRYNADTRHGFGYKEVKFPTPAAFSVHKKRMYRRFIAVSKIMSMKTNRNDKGALYLNDRLAANAFKLLSRGRYLYLPSSARIKVKIRKVSPKKKDEEENK